MTLIFANFIDERWTSDDLLAIGELTMSLIIIILIEPHFLLTRQHCFRNERQYGIGCWHARFGKCRVIEQVRDKMWYGLFKTVRS